MLTLAAFLATVFVHSLISRRLERTVLTAPVVFTAMGFALVSVNPEALDLVLARKGFLLLAEIGLVMTLFADATRVDFKVLLRDERLPLRLLSIGMLLTIVLGAAGALLVFPSLSIWEAGILAAILAPTDAGLGEVVVTSPRVPGRIRQALSVEAGLNDGLSVPFLMLCIAMGRYEIGGPGQLLAGFLLSQLGYGALIGCAAGLVGGWLLGRAQRSGWMAKNAQQLGLVTLPLLCVLASEHVGASMFIAAYVAGICVQPGFRDAGAHGVEFTEGWGRLLDFFIFFLFGMVVAPAVGAIDSRIIFYAVLSLSAVRMLPVALALAGTGFCTATTLFMGWFGPRGLASIVLGLIYLEEEANLPGEPIIRLVIIATVLLSILAHGLSAMPGISVYARAAGKLPAEAPEYRAAAGS